MRYIQINSPNHILRVSRIAMGTDYFGTTVPEKEAFSMLDAFVEAGGNCIDTARSYAAWMPNGEGASEALIGRWLKRRGNRPKILISTKGGYPPVGRMHEGRLSRACIESDLDESLRTLNTDYIDLYWLHRDEVTRPVEEIMETVTRLVSSGRIRAVGCSNWKTKRIGEANAYAEAHGWVQFCTSQIQWSLASSTPQAYKDDTIVCMTPGEYAWYIKNNMTVMAYSSQAQGFFAREAAHGLEAVSRNATERFLSPDNMARLERVKAYADRHNVPVTGVVLGYILCNRLPAVAIVGCKNMSQMKDSLAAADISIPVEDADWLYAGSSR